MAGVTLLITWNTSGETSFDGAVVHEDAGDKLLLAVFDVDLLETPLVLPLTDGSGGVLQLVDVEFGHDTTFLMCGTAEIDTGWIAVVDVLQGITAMKTFSGTPANADVGTLVLRLSATDSSGLTAVVDVKLQLDEVNLGVFGAQLFGRTSTDLNVDLLGSGTSVVVAAKMTSVVGGESTDAPQGSGLWTFEVPALPVRE